MNSLTTVSEYLPKEGLLYLDWLDIDIKSLKQKSEEQILHILTSHTNSVSDNSLQMYNLKIIYKALKNKWLDIMSEENKILRSELLSHLNRFEKWRLCEMMWNKKDAIRLHTIASKKLDPNQAARAMNHLWSLYTNIGNTQLAIDTFLKVEECGNDEMSAWSMCNLWLLYAKSNDVVKSKESFLKVDKFGFNKPWAKAMVSLWALYKSRIKDTEKAKESYLKVERYEIDKHSAQAMMELWDLYKDTDVEKAEESYLKVESYGINKYTALTMRKLWDLYKDTDVEKAEENYFKVVEYGNDEESALAMKDLYNLFIETDRKKAERYVLKAVEYAKKRQDDELLRYVMSWRFRSRLKIFESWNI